MIQKTLSVPNVLRCDRYEFRLPNGLHVVAAAGAAAGQLYLASGAAPDARWEAASPRLRPAINSFQLGAAAGRI